MEALHTNTISPGSPIKQTAVLKKTIAYMDSIDPKDAMHVCATATSSVSVRSSRHWAGIYIELHCDQNGSVGDGSFLDIRTVLPCDEPCIQAQLDQGEIAHDVVKAWLVDRRPSQIEAMAARIPTLPRREDDFTLRAGARKAASR
jgi:hypothetical protein